MDAEAAVRAWIDGWSRAWPARDADAVAALYAEDAVFRFGADGLVEEQRDYWAGQQGRSEPPPGWGA